MLIRLYAVAARLSGSNPSKPWGVYTSDLLKWSIIGGPGFNPRDGRSVMTDLEALSKSSYPKLEAHVVLGTPSNTEKRITAPISGFQIVIVVPNLLQSPDPSIQECGTIYQCMGSGLKHEGTTWDDIMSLYGEHMAARINSMIIASDACKAHTEIT